MEHITTRGYSLENSYAELYWKFPQFLLKNDKYKKMKDSSKIAYMLFKDRITLAIAEKWIDENQMLYLIFQQKELMNLLDCYQGKVKSTLDELVKYGLLEIVRGAFDPKTGKNAPNKYYLLRPELETTDIYVPKEKQVESLDNSGYAEIARRSYKAETLDKTGYAEIAHRPQTLDNSGYAEIAHDKDISIPDTLKEDTKKIDTEKEKQRQTILLANYSKIQDHSFLNKSSLETLAIFSDTVEEASKRQGIILDAKKKAEKQEDCILIAEDWQEEIELCLHRVLHKIKTDHKIKNTDNFMFKSFYNMFVECALQKRAWLKEKEVVAPKIVTHDWVEK